MQANKSKLRAPRALCCLTLSNPIRMAALALVEWKYPSVTLCVCVLEVFADQISVIPSIINGNKRIILLIISLYAHIMRSLSSKMF